MDKIQKRMVFQHGNTKTKDIPKELMFSESSLSRYYSTKNRNIKNIRPVQGMTPEYMKTNKTYNYSSKLPQEEVQRYTTWKELLKELLIMLPLAIIGYGIMAVVALI